MFNRLLERPQRQSFFLFGARGTGKSTWLREHFTPAEVYLIDLLDPKTQRIYTRRPEHLTAELEAVSKKVRWVIIDEIQKCPKLLDVVHAEIERKKFHFAMTGSSARKLKRGAANMLAGRAIWLSMHPLTYRELGNDFDISNALHWGTLPYLSSLKSSSEKEDYLHTYAHLYLKEEIKEEQIVRQLEPFERFLEVAAQMDSKILNYSKIAKDVGIDTKTVISFFQILEDTLLGHRLPAYHRSVRKRQKQNPKFYFFDSGVRRALENTLDLKLHPKTSEWGRAFECFLMNQIFALNSYSRKRFNFSFIHAGDNSEVDLVIEKGNRSLFLVEFKSSSFVDESDAKVLNRFSQDFKGAECLLLSQDPKPKVLGQVKALHWQKGIDLIFS